MATDMTAKTTYDFDQMLSSAREAYGEELMKMADEGLDFVFTYSDNVAASSATGNERWYPDRCFNFGIAEPNQVGASAGLALAGEIVFYRSWSLPSAASQTRFTRTSHTTTSMYV